jgi:hypothetical protein
MRVLRIAAARQLALFAAQDDCAARWDGLPEHVQAQVLALLAKMIARSAAGPGAAGGSREVRS